MTAPVVYDPIRLRDRVLRWQKSDSVHPLTCGTKSSHPNLVPVIVAEGNLRRLVLRCDACDYRQEGSTIAWMLDIDMNGL